MSTLNTIADFQARLIDGTLTNDNIIDGLVSGIISREEASKMLGQLDVIKKIAASGDFAFKCEVVPEEKCVKINCGKGAPIKIELDKIKRGETLWSEENSAIVREKLAELRNIQF